MDDIEIIFEKGTTKNIFIKNPYEGQPEYARFAYAEYRMVDYSAYFYLEGFKFYFVESRDSVNKDPCLLEASTGALATSKLFLTTDYPSPSRFPVLPDAQIKVLAQSLKDKIRRSGRPLGVTVNNFKERNSIELEPWLNVLL